MSFNKSSLKKIKSIDVGCVGGSDLKKQIEQLGEENFHLFDWRFSENGVLAFKGNEQINNLSFKDFMGEKHFMKFINIVLKNGLKQVDMIIVKFVK